MNSKTIIGTLALVALGLMLTNCQSNLHGAYSSDVSRLTAVEDETGFHINIDGGVVDVPIDEEPLPPISEDPLPVPGEDPLPPDGENPLPPSAEDPVPPSVEDCENQSLDSDCDGFDNPEDDFPNVCTDIVIIMNDVESLWVLFNNSDVVPHNELKGSGIKTVRYNLPASSSLDIRLAGEPGSSVKVQIYNCSVNPSEKLFERELIREAGRPQE